MLWLTLKKSDTCSVSTDSKKETDFYIEKISYFLALLPLFLKNIHCIFSDHKCNILLIEYSENTQKHKEDNLSTEDNHC